MAAEDWLDERYRPADAQRFVGMPADEAVDGAHRAGIAVVRVLQVVDGSVGPYTLDFRPARLNLAVEGGRVVRAAFF